MDLQEVVVMHESTEDTRDMANGDRVNDPDGYAIEKEITKPTEPMHKTERESIAKPQKKLLEMLYTKKDGLGYQSEKEQFSPEAVIVLEEDHETKSVHSEFMAPNVAENNLKSWLKFVLRLFVVTIGLVGPAAYLIIMDASRLPNLDLNLSLQDLIDLGQMKTGAHSVRWQIGRAHV